MRTSILVLAIFLNACKQETTSDRQTLDFGLFTIETPKTWKKINRQGIDSYVGEIAIDSTDTVGFNLGYYSNTLTEPEPMIVERSSLQYYKNVDTSELVLVDNSRGLDPDEFRKQTLLWDTIDGREAKVVYPRNPGKGITGAYIDTLWTDDLGVNRFNIAGANLKPENQKEFLKALKTLKFHKN